MTTFSPLLNNICENSKYGIFGNSKPSEFSSDIQNNQKKKKFSPKYGDECNNGQKQRTTSLWLNNKRYRFLVKFLIRGVKIAKVFVNKQNQISKSQRNSFYIYLKTSC